MHKVVNTLSNIDALFPNNTTNYHLVEPWDPSLMAKTDGEEEIEDIVQKV